MSQEINPAEANRALAEIEHRHGQVVDLLNIPWWYWWAVALLCVALGVAVDSHRATAIGTVVPVFVVGMLVATALVVLPGHLRVRPRRDLVDAGGVLAVLGFDAIVIAVSLGTAFTLRGLGMGHPATVGILPAAVLLVAGGPVLNRLVRHRMLANRAGRR